MNVVIFRNGATGPRQFRLNSAGFVASAVAVVGIVCGAVFAGGYNMAKQGNDLAGTTELLALRAELDAQRAEIVEAQQKAEDTFDALAIRLGQMNAHVIRLNALGRRLTEMARLEDGEFDFDSPPAIGGPEETESLANMDRAGMVAELDTLAVSLADRERQLEVLESVLLTRNLGEQIFPEGRPVKAGWISSYFGKRTDPFTGKTARHKGVDFAGKAGADIVAVASGVVTYSGNRFGYGLMVEIDHGNGYVTRYAHNAENAVQVGDEVRKGDVIGYIGSTGRATGPNLHFEVIKDNKVLNPLNFIKSSK
jgi:murein DD-endopeptidase MepM/ murein hydrolase activator NlpD